jgi:uncharacterized damage-inducible protein DinB
MTPTELLKDAFGRIAESTERVLGGLSDEQLTHRVAPEANTIGWLVWHLTRVQDDHIADVAGTEQVWTAQEYADRLGLPFEEDATGYGQTAEAVGQVKVSADDLWEYHRATHAATLAYLDTLTAEDLDRVVDERWDPPVTLAVRLVSVINDDTQHVGQAAYVRGLLGH